LNLLSRLRALSVKQAIKRKISKAEIDKMVRETLLCEKIKSSLIL
jgi:hypothetical protein